MINVIEQHLDAMRRDLARAVDLDACGKTEEAEAAVARAANSLSIAYSQQYHVLEFRLLP